MAKAALPIRLQESRFHRSPQSRLSIGLLSCINSKPRVLLSASSDLSIINIEPIYSEPLDPDDVIQALENDWEDGRSV